MPRKSATKSSAVPATTDNIIITPSDTIDENHANEFMAEVSAPVEPEKKVELNGLLDKLAPQAPAEKDAPTDILERILATEPKKRGRKPGSGKKGKGAMAFLEDLEASQPTVSFSAEVVDVDKEKADVLAKIYMNANNFELVLKDVLRPSKDDFLKSVSKKGLGELRGLLRLMEHTRTVNNSANQLKHLVFMGASGVEMLSQSLGMKTQGYAQVIRAQEEEIQSILREIALENADKLQKYQSPSVRLTLLLTTTLLAVDSRGRQMEFQRMNAPPPPGVAERYSNL